MKMKTYSLSLLILFSLLSCVQKEPNPDVTTKVLKGSIVNQVNLSGRAEASEQISVISPDDLSVLSLKTQTGSRIKKDEILCILDPKKSTEQLRTEELKYQQLLAQLEVAQIRLNGLSKDEERTNKLYNSGAASLDDKEKIKQELQIQLSSINVLKMEVSDLEKIIEKRKNEISMLDIKSSVDGVITHMWTTKDTFVEGSSVKKGDILFKISIDGPMMAKAVLREKDVVHFARGQKLELTFPSLPKLKIEGRVKEVDDSATIDKDSGTASFRIYVEFTPTRDIRSGMEVMISHLINKKENILLIPHSSFSLLENGKGEVIQVVGGKRTKKIIQTGLLGESHLEVLSGLNQNDEVLLNYEE